MLLILLIDQETIMDDIRQSNTEIVMKKTLTYSDANELGFISAGDVTKIADMTVELLGSSYCKKQFVTVCIDRQVFNYPVRINDTLVVKASINYIRNTSMEVGVHIEVETKGGRHTEHVVSAFIVLVAVNKKLQPVPIPQFEPQTPDQKRRYRDGKKRMEERLRLREKAKRKKG